jgi:hypothetical protein
MMSFLLVDRVLARAEARGQATWDKADRELQKRGADAVGTIPRVTLVCELCFIVTCEYLFRMNET